MDEMIPALWIHLGGMDRIREIKEKIKPEYLEVDLVLPVKGSEEQEGGFFAFYVGRTLSFGWDALVSIRLGFGVNVPNPVAYKSLQQVLEGGQAVLSEGEVDNPGKEFFPRCKGEAEIMGHLRITCHE